MTDFTGLKLHSTILENINKLGYIHPTLIQERTIPVLLKGHDLLGIAQTGTGKTASFSLPLIDKILQKKVLLDKFEIRSLIIAPTRELATQIYENICAYAPSDSISIKCVIGGVRKEGQIEFMEKGADILVATPGRLMDLMSGGYVRSTNLDTFILDEADMMLDMGFYEDVKVISQKLPEKRQTIMFSATMPKEIEELARNILTKAIKISSAKESTTLDTVDQSVYYLQEDDKLNLLLSLLSDNSLSKVIIFCKAKYSVPAIVNGLNLANITNCEIHSNCSQTERNAAIQNFTDGSARVMVATDIASRGIDIDNISHVINYNMPEDPTFYVHRIGRTARAGRSGVAISFCAERDLALLRNVKKLIKVEIPEILNHPFHFEYAPLEKQGKHKPSSASMRQRKRPSQAKRAAKKKFLSHL